MSDYDKFWEGQMQDPDFKNEWEKSELEYQVARAMLKARMQQDLTQKELSEKTGITQADINRIERGCANPSLNTLYRLAKGLGMMIKISFVKEKGIVCEGDAMCVAESF